MLADISKSFKESGSNWKKVAKIGIYNKHAVIKMVIAIISNTRLFLYFNVAIIE